MTTPLHPGTFAAGDVLIDIKPNVDKIVEESFAASEELEAEYRLNGKKTAIKLSILFLSLSFSFLCVALTYDVEELTV